MCSQLSHISHLHELYGHSRESVIPLNFRGSGGNEFKKSAFILTIHYILCFNFATQHFKYPIGKPHDNLLSIACTVYH